MAALISSDFEIPAEISQGIFEKAQKGSTLAQLSGARPQKFGKQQVWVLTSPPKAELVGEAEPDCNPCRNCIRNWNYGSGSIYKDREGGRVI